MTARLMTTNDITWHHMTAQRITSHDKTSHHTSNTSKHMTWHDLTSDDMTWHVMSPKAALLQLNSEPTVLYTSFHLATSHMTSSRITSPPPACHGNATSHHENTPRKNSWRLSRFGQRHWLLFFLRAVYFFFGSLRFVPVTLPPLGRPGTRVSKNHQKKKQTPRNSANFWWINSPGFADPVRPVKTWETWRLASRGRSNSKLKTVELRWTTANKLPNWAKGFYHNLFWQRNLAKRMAW